MTEKQMAIRLPEDWLERAAALVEHVEKEPRYAAFGKVSRATIVRLAIAIGLEELEKQYGTGQSDE